ncbi:MAG: hypothetical protein JWO44_527 [Bacteroidetes bacterium]|nr:hypothetical protein [Bacteroidota bacterium]
MIPCKKRGILFPLMRIIPALIIACLLSACSQPGNPVQVKSPARLLVQDTLRVTKEFTGIYFDDGVGKFIACGQPQMIYRVKDNTQLNAALKKILPNAYKGEAIFVKMNAELSSIESKIFAGLLEVKEVLKTEQKNPENTCIPSDFWCMGTEPFWQLQISEKENLIDLYNPMEQKTIHTAYVKPEVKEGTITYTTLNNSKETNFRIVIIKKKCSDGMSGREYDYEANILMNGTAEYKGCAVTGN